LLETSQREAEKRGLMAAALTAMMATKVSRMAQMVEVLIPSISLRHC
jgi:hypothetical protein